MALRRYRTNRWLWAGASIVLLVAIDLGSRFRILGGEEESLGRALIRYFVALVNGEEQLSTQPLFLMAAWVAIAVTGGWLLQSLLVLFISKAKNTKPSN